MPYYCHKNCDEICRSFEIRPYCNCPHQDDEGQCDYRGKNSNCMEDPAITLKELGQ